jgi:hypothetical protein
MTLLSTISNESINDNLKKRSAISFCCDSETCTDFDITPSCVLRPATTRFENADIYVN